MYEIQQEFTVDPIFIIIIIVILYINKLWLTSSLIHCAYYSVIGPQNKKKGHLFLCFFPTLFIQINSQNQHEYNCCHQSFSKVVIYYT